MKKDYDGPLYAPWHKVVEGKKHNTEWLKRHGISSTSTPTESSMGEEGVSIRSSEGTR
jgi:hypothetical protein